MTDQRNNPYWLVNNEQYLTVCQTSRPEWHLNDIVMLKLDPRDTSVRCKLKIQYFLIGIL